ncbi:MAG: hypothetical protein WC044_00920 [Crocinitomicaceae bacterium]
MGPFLKRENTNLEISLSVSQFNEELVLNFRNNTCHPIKLFVPPFLNETVLQIKGLNILNKAYSHKIGGLVIDWKKLVSIPEYHLTLPALHSEGIKLQNRRVTLLDIGKEENCQVSIRYIFPMDEEFQNEELIGQIKEHQLWTGTLESSKFSNEWVNCLFNDQSQG